MKEPNGHWPFQFERVHLDLLAVDHRYQRELKPAWVRKRMEDFDVLLFGTPITSLRKNGKHYLLDGQQRVEVVRRLQYDESVFVQIYQNLSLRQEAHIFVHYNVDRSSVTHPQIYRARLAAGDSVILEIDKIVRSRGFEVGIHKTKATHLSCPGALIKIFELDTDVVRAGYDTSIITGPFLLGSTLGVLDGAWRNTNFTDEWTLAKSSALVRGIARWIALNPEFPQGDLIEALRDVLPSHIHYKSKEISKGSGSGKGRRYDEIIDDILHQHKRKNIKAA